MKRTLAIFFCLLIAVAPTLALVPSQSVAAADDCGTCPCESKACCAENSESDSPNKPAAPAKSGKRHLSPASQLTVAIELLSHVERGVGVGNPSHDSFKSSAAPIYTWNCAFLI